MAASTEVVRTLAGLNAGLSLPPAVLAFAAPEGAAFMSSEAVDPVPGLPALQCTQGTTSWAWARGGDCWEARRTFRTLVRMECTELLTGRGALGPRAPCAPPR